MKFCPNCGMQLPDGIKFCTECGQKIETPAPAAPAQTSGAPAWQGTVQPERQEPAAPRQSVTPPQQEYTPPQQAYTPPQQGYTPPQQGNVPPYFSGGYGAPAGPEEKKPINKKIFLFGGIALAVVLVIVLVVVLVSGGGGKNDPNLGRYEAVSYSISGVELGAEGDWFELKAKGKADVRFMEEEFSGTWELDGEKFTFRQGGDAYQGTLKDGVLTIDLAGMQCTFAKDGATPAPTATTPAATTGTLPPKAQNGTEETGYWTLLRVDSSDPNMVMSEEDLAMFKDFGMEFFMDLSADGTGALVIDEPVHVSWKGGKISLETGEELAYTLADGLLHLDIEGSDYVFTRGEGTAPSIDWSDSEPEPEPTVDIGLSSGEYDWWSGKWYGWVVISDANSAYEDVIDMCYDCTAIIYVFDDGTGYMELTYIDDEELGWASVSFGAGTTENGCMMSESGNIFGLDIVHADWIVDPGASMVSDFDHMIHIDSTMFDEEGDWFDYDLFLRPWGMDWEDVRVADTTGMLYSDMMPLYYDDWYLPQIGG